MRREPELYRTGRTRQDRGNALGRGFSFNKNCSGESPRVKSHRDHVGGTLAGVGNDDEQIVLFAGAHRRRMPKSHREVRIAHQNRPTGFALEGYRTNGETFQDGSESEVNLMSPLFQSFDSEIRLSRFTRLQGAAIIGGSGHAVGP